MAVSTPSLCQFIAATYSATMSAAEVDLDQLSESERLVLEQYTGVTGQDPAEAIPLLRRSQWNVQVGRYTSLPAPAEVAS
jgi:hypothetical protein